MKISGFHRHAFDAFALMLAISIVGCSGKTDADQEASTSMWRNHIPDNSDLLVVADMAAIEKSEWRKNADNQDDTMNAELRAKAGFSQDDVSLLIVASDLDAFPPIDDLKAIAAASQTNAAALQGVIMPSINATVLLQLNKSISWQQARTAVDVLFADTANAVIRDADDENRVIITQKSSNVPLHVTLAENGRILRLTTYKPSSSNANSLAPLFLADQSIQTNGLIRISMHASEAMRVKIKESIESTLAAPAKDATALMLASLMKSFVSFAGMSMALNPSDSGTDVFGTFDLGTAEQANSAEAVINTVLIPLITLALTQYTNENSPAVMQDTTTSVQGSHVILRTKLNAQSMTLPGPSANRQR